MTPSLEDVLDSAHVVSIPMRTAFRGIRHREAVIIRGEQRWTEFSPFVEYGDEEAATWLHAALEFGWDDLPARQRDSIDVNATIPAVAPNDVSGILARFDRCRAVKIKVAEPGQLISDDIARVGTVRRIVGQDVRIRLDANGSWRPAEAVAAIRSLAEFGIDYVEQPTMGLHELVWVRNELDGLVRIAADEAVRKATDPIEVARAGGADLLIVKAQPLGGVHRALRLVKEAGLPVVVSSALDTSVGISMGAALAASLPEAVLDGPCGLATVELLAGDVTAEPLTPRNGAIPVRDVDVTDRLLKQFRAPADREAWWRKRVRRCYALLTR